MPQFQSFVEIPVDVFYTRQRFIPRSRHEEGQAAAIGIHDIELADDLKEWILKEYNQQFIEEAWENLRIGSTMTENQKGFKKQSPDKDLQKWDDRHPAPTIQNDSASSMLMLAIQNKYSPEFIREMMDLRDREEARVKEQAHFKAFADFKKNPFDLIKDKINKQTGNSPYISVGKLLSIVNPELAKVGLIANFRIKDSEDFQHITVTCVLSHELGHSIESGMSAKVETTGPKGSEVMTEMHARLSALTYLMKATFSAVVGVAGQDKQFDDDGNKAGAKLEFITPGQIKAITKRMKKVYEDDGVRFLSWLGVETVDTIPTNDYKKAIDGLTSAEKALEQKAQREPGDES